VNFNLSQTTDLFFCLRFSDRKALLTGALLHVIFPNWLILLLMVILLSATTYRTGTKGYNLWKKETQSDKIPREAFGGEQQQETFQVYEFNPEEPEDFQLQAEQDQVNKILLKEEKTPIAKIGLLVAILAIIFLFTFFKGGATGFPPNFRFFLFFPRSENTR
jgi:hypothetical protein